MADVPEETLDLVLRPALLELLSTPQGNLSRDTEATFLYYSAGEGLPLHLDNDATYEYNLLICIDNELPVVASKRRSATYFYLGNDKVKAAALEPGQGVWFHAGFTPHARTPLIDEASITLLSIGMQLEA